MKVKKNLLKSRAVVGLLCIGLTLLISFFIIPKVNEKLSRQIPVIRAKKDISAGEKITEDLLYSVKMVDNNLPEGIIQKKEEIIGQYTTGELFKDDYFTKSKVQQGELKSNVEKALLKNDPKDEDRLIYAASYKVMSLEMGVGNRLKAGDVISLYAAKEKEALALFPELKYLEILAVSNKDGADRKGDEESKEYGRTEVITLALRRAQVALLADYVTDKGSLYTALIYRGGDKVKTQLLSMQEAYLDEQLALKLEMEARKAEAEANDPNAFSPEATEPEVTVPEDVPSETPEENNTPAETPGTETPTEQSEMDKVIQDNIRKAEEKARRVEAEAKRIEEEKRAKSQEEKKRIAEEARKKAEEARKRAEETRKKANP